MPLTRPQSGSAPSVIASLTAKLQADFALHPVTAAEIEFYLEDVNEAPFWQAVMAACEAFGITLAKYEKERGEGQYEAALAPASDAGRTVRDLNNLKTIITDVAKEQGGRADFSAAPLTDQPGSGLHIHIHLADAEGKNQFYKDDSRMSDALRYSLGGLVTWVSETMPVFAPGEASYARFAPGRNAPVTASWGANNRTVAIRLPDKPHANKHIEHRVAGADADVEKVMAVILAAMHDGLSRRLAPGEQIYGDASLAMYDLPLLPKTLHEAKERMRLFAPLENYFSDGEAL